MTTESSAAIEAQLALMLKILIGLDSQVSAQEKTAIAKAEGNVNDILNMLSAGLSQLHYTAIINTMRLGVEAAYHRGVSDGQSEVIALLQKQLEEKKDAVLG